MFCAFEPHYPLEVSSAEHQYHHEADLWVDVDTAMRACVRARHACRACVRACVRAGRQAGERWAGRRAGGILDSSVSAGLRWKVKNGESATSKLFTGGSQQTIMQQLECQHQHVPNTNMRLTLLNDQGIHSARR